MKEAKQPNHVLGKKTNCPNFVQCPICYGCRAYSTADLNCGKCTINKKRDICNVELHKADLINKLISKTQINFEKEDNISFISAEHKEEKHD